MIRRTPLALGLIVVATSLGACKEPKQEPLSYGEAQQALEESELSTEATKVVGGTIELSTNFTIGQAVEQAAEELGEFIASQLPCAEIVLDGQTLTVEYGARPGSCTYKGQEYTGTHVVTVARAESGDIEVEHEWTELSNGVLSVSGTASVTWSWVAESRRVVHELTWTRLEDGRSGTGSGDVVQTVLEGGLLEGIVLDGSHEWVGQSGDWTLDIDGLEARWLDPVPQAGAFYLTTPSSKEVTITFERVDADTIEVTIKSGDDEFTINVTSIDL